MSAPSKNAGFASFGPSELVELASLEVVLSVTSDVVDCEASVASAPLVVFEAAVLVAPLLLLEAPLVRGPELWGEASEVVGAVFVSVVAVFVVFVVFVVLVGPVLVSAGSCDEVVSFVCDGWVELVPQAATTSVIRVNAEFVIRVFVLCLPQVLAVRIGHATSRTNTGASRQETILLSL